MNIAFERADEYATGAESYFHNAIQGVAHSLRSSHEAAPGDVIGSYRIVVLIGRGGMGSVYLAERGGGEIQQRVAVKLLHPEWQRLGLDRFLKECQVLISLHHPSIVHAIEAGRAEDGRPFLVMEHVAGEAIDIYAAGIGLRDRLRLFLRVCEGVSYAHRRLIIHRDLKPSNILIDRSGQPKILDFGIAKFLDEAEDAIEIVDRLLTPNYASPEQLEGRAHTIATDVYSMGAVFYKLLTGAAPRQNRLGSPNSGIVPPNLVNSSIPKAVDFIVTKALHAEPKKRYVSVDEFANDVQAVLNGLPLSTEHPELLRR